MLKIDERRLTVRTLPGTDIGPACGVPLVRGEVKAGRKVAPDLLHRRRAARRSLIDARHEKNAIEHILTLPEEGESLHFVIDGRFEPCDLIPATRRLSHPATISELTITTLSYNLENVATLCNGLDQGKIGRLLLVPSRYFARVEKPLFNHTLEELTKRGSRVIAGEVHTKLILMEMTDGRCFTIEGSGNLRSCKSIEQFVFTNDRPLLEFHRGWIETYIAERTTYGRREGRTSGGASRRSSAAIGGDGVSEAGDQLGGEGQPSSDVDSGRQFGPSDS